MIIRYPAGIYPQGKAFLAVPCGHLPAGYHFFFVENGKASYLCILAEMNSLVLVKMKTRNTGIP